MAKNLVIVESPAKAKTIARFLGKEFEVKSSYGHVRDLPKDKLSIDIQNNYKPTYVILPEKKKIIEELKKSISTSDVVWLATDEDREGEAIAWHLYETLQLAAEKTKRIVFHEITKPAILEAVANPRFLNFNLINAQQARRVIDRLVGYKLSPLLWKKVKPAISAGRVQSVAVRLLVEREEQIRHFQPEEFFKITGIFLTADGKKFHAELNEKFNSEKEALMVLEHLKNASFFVSHIEEKPGLRVPPPPFTTSTLQQEASRKLGFSVSQTMYIAQQLYEEGWITYMRTDSVHLSNLAIQAIKKIVFSKFGEVYSKPRQFETQTKGAQEAHEAIRPTYIDRLSIEGNTKQQKLYELIWKRAVASQMTEAKLKRTIIHISSPVLQNFYFIAKGEIIVFDGFLHLYEESHEDEDSMDGSFHLPSLSLNDLLNYEKITAEQKFTHPPYRYSEAQLVKSLEELGIGRPSTYAPIIETIQKRKYVEKKSFPPQTRKVIHFVLEGSEITKKIISEKFGGEKNKLVPTDLGIVVNKFLTHYFADIVDYGFTASLEQQFDEVAEGKTTWQVVVDEFYKQFSRKLSEVEHLSGKFQGQRLLGIDPKTGKKVYVKVGPYGSMAQLGDAADEEKPRFASLLAHQSVEEITLEEALSLFEFPKKLGRLEKGEVTVGSSKYGYFIHYDGKYFSIPPGIDPTKLTLLDAQRIIEKNHNEGIRVLKEFDKDILIVKGKFGPYIKYKQHNIPLRHVQDFEKLSKHDLEKIVEEYLKTKGPEDPKNNQRQRSKNIKKKK
ncbi:MAG: type I DNA topoisomerase [Bacteroidales bacterium]|nr:type I DNA topoisomerase [Bacteroidales bacterium]